MNRANVAARLKEIQDDREAQEEAAVLHSWLKLSDREAVLKRTLKDAEAGLDAEAVSGSGKRGQVLKEDIASATFEAANAEDETPTAAAPAPSPAPASKTGSMPVPAQHLRLP